MLRPLSTNMYAKKNKTVNRGYSSTQLSLEGNSKDQKLEESNASAQSLFRI